MVNIVSVGRGCEGRAMVRGGGREKLVGGYVLMG